MTPQALLRWCTLILLTTACTANQRTTPETTVSATPDTAPVPTIYTQPPDKTPTSAVTPRLSATFTPAPLPTFTSAPVSSVAPVPSCLRVAFILEDSLYLWEDGLAQLVLTRPDISSPMLSADGERVIFRQNLTPHGRREEEVWVIRTDDTELHRVLTPDVLASLTDSSLTVLIDDLAWLPNSQSLLLTTVLINETSEAGWDRPRPFLIWRRIMPPHPRGSPGLMRPIFFLPCI